MACLVGEAVFDEQKIISGTVTALRSKSGTKLFWEKTRSNASESSLGECDSVQDACMRVHREREPLGDWSTAMWQCDSLYVAIMSTCCPCLLIAELLFKTGPVQTPCGRLNAWWYLLLWKLVFFLYKPFDLWCDVPIVWTEPDQIPWYDGSVILPFRYKQSATGILLTVSMWALTAVVMRGIRNHYGVAENDGMTCAKAACWYDCTFCLQPFALAQAARHVYHAQEASEPVALE